MSWTDALYFANVVEVSRTAQAWSNEANAGGASEPDDTDYAETSSLAMSNTTNWLAFYNPACAAQVPGNELSTTFLTLEVQIRGATEDDTNGDFRLDTYGFSDGSDFVVNSAFTVAPQTKTYSKSVASWGLTQAEVWDFLLNGSSSKAFRWYGDRSGVAGLVKGRCHWALCRVEYTYAPLPGSGILVGKL